MPSLPPLPIDAVLPELVSKLKLNGAVVLKAPTGAGKTTRVPPAVMNEKLTILLEPRRVAARAAARRMAFEDGSKLGDRYGYQVRFDRCASANSRVLTVTPGILLRMLQDDPFLETAGCVVFDEFHERGLESDLALGLVHLLRSTVRPDLQVVVMSATLDGEAIAAYLGNCPVVVSEGRSFPVIVSYRPRRPDEPVVESCARAIRDVLPTTPGDILAFLPGVGELNRVMERLDGVDAEVLLLHGEMPPEQQDRALMKLPHRKIVLATNVAETSVTVDGVTAVVDSGQARQLSFEANVGMNRLSLMPISQASADQRAGRAGRTMPGVCVRLWDEPSHRARPSHTEPEIRRIDLAPAVLQLLAMNEDVERFPWFEPPREETVRNAVQLLTRLGAIENRALTDLGKAMADVPVHPRLARMLLGHPRPETALAAAILSDRDPFERGSRSVSTESDLLDRVEAVEEFARSGRTQFDVGVLHRHAARQLLQARDQLLRSVPRSGGASCDSLLEALLLGFPDRVCKRREKNDRRSLMAGGRGVKLAPSSGVNDAELFLALDVDAGGIEALVRMASMIQRDWLNTVARHEIVFESGRIQGRKRLRYDDLIIDDLPAHIADESEAARVLAANVMLHQLTPSPAAVSFLNRWEFWMQSQSDLKPVDLDAILPELCRGCRSIDDINRADWLGAIRGMIEWKTLQRFDREVPETVTVPSGREVELVYEPGRPPVLAAKIQELFGMTETPVIAGKVKVLVHLLAPNGRPQQVTDDLASFWKTTYAVVRKELRGRYPKHDWPEDPTTAIASRGVRRKPG